MQKIGKIEKVKQVRDSYERIAESYDRVRHKPWKECEEYIKEIRRNSLVLDLGCGTGRHLISAVKEGHEVIGLDFSKTMLKVAKKKLSTTFQIMNRTNLILGDVSNLPFRDNSFGYVLFIATLHNIPTNNLRIDSLNEVRRVLKMDGLSLITVWRRFQVRFFFDVIKFYIKKLVGFDNEFAVTVPWKTKDLIVPRYYYLFSAKELKHIISQSSLRILKFLKVRIGAKLIPDNFFVLVIKVKLE